MVEAIQNSTEGRLWSVRSLSLAVLVFIVAVIPRCVGLFSGPQHADEGHWIKRTEQVIKKLSSDRDHATSHLGHPGVVPALVLVAGELGARTYNEVFNAAPGDYWFIDSVEAARLTNALVSSILPSFLFLALLSWTGVAEALGIALLVALSPRFIDLSRIVHIDSIQALVVSVTVFAWLASLRRASWKIHVVVGVLFGFCLLSKPTSIALIPAFVVATSLLGWLWPTRFEKRFVSWSEMWTGVLSLVVFCLLYTRMWNHGESFIEWVQIAHEGPHKLYELGLHLRKGWLGILAGGLIAILAVLQWKEFRKGTALRWHWHVITLFVFMVAWLIVFPVSWENVARYWLRVFGLTSVKHQSFVGTTAAIPGGYLTLGLMDLHPLVIVGVLSSALLLLPWCRRALKHQEEQILLVAVLISFFWLAILSSSSKQSWRYALSVTPFVYIVAVVSLSALCRSVAPLFGKLAVVVLVVGQVSSAVCAYPAWDMHHSDLARVLSPEKRLEILRPRSGAQEVLRYLRDAAKQRGEKVYVTVLGDGASLQHEAARTLAGDRKLIHVGYFSEFAADFIVVQRALPLVASGWEHHMQKPAAFEVAYGGLPVFSIFAVTPDASKKEYYVPYGKMHVERGERELLGGVPHLSVKPRSWERGQLVVFPSGVMLNAGSNSMEFFIGSPPKKMTGISSETAVARFQVSKECSYILSAEEYRRAPKSISVPCHLSESRRVFPHVYWFGEVPLAFSGMTIRLP